MAGKGHHGALLLIAASCRGGSGAEIQTETLPKVVGGKITAFAPSPLKGAEGWGEGPAPAINRIEIRARLPVRANSGAALLPQLAFFPEGYNGARGR
jgi:hypothetical protein